MIFTPENDIILLQYQKLLQIDMSRQDRCHQALTAHSDLVANKQRRNWSTLTTWRSVDKNCWEYATLILHGRILTRDLTTIIWSIRTSLCQSHRTTDHLTLTWTSSCSYWWGNEQEIQTDVIQRCRCHLHMQAHHFRNFDLNQVNTCTHPKAYLQTIGRRLICRASRRVTRTHFRLITESIFRWSTHLCTRCERALFCTTLAAQRVTNGPIDESTSGRIAAGTIRSCSWITVFPLLHDPISTHLKPDKLYISVCINETGGVNLSAFNSSHWSTWKGKAESIATWSSILWMDTYIYYRCCKAKNFVLPIEQRETWEIDPLHRRNLRSTGNTEGYLRSHPRCTVRFNW